MPNIHKKQLLGEKKIYKIAQILQPPPMKKFKMTLSLMMEFIWKRPKGKAEP